MLETFLENQTSFISVHLSSYKGWLKRKNYALFLVPTLAISSIT